ncbi:MAG TPA: tetratricopeptide repeat protein [Terracidiphilus sp.]
MLRAHTLPHRLFTSVVIAGIFLCVSAPACAASKEIIELQAQVQQLLDNVQRIQSTLDSRLGVIQHLAEQTADDANRMTATVTALQQKLSTQGDALTSKMDVASGQAQSLNDSVDELKSRISKLDKSIQELQTQLQNIQTAPAAAPASTTPVTPAAQPAPAPAPVPAPVPAPNGPAAIGSAPAAESPDNQTPPLAETFQAGLRDYNAAKYEVAAGEFQDVIHFYPLDDLAGSSHFYLGEIAYKQLKLTEAVKSYNAVLEGFPGNSKAPAAQLRKGLALLEMNRRDAGIHELRTLIQRHPQTAEAAQARTKLNAMGVKPSAAH